MSAAVVVPLMLVTATLGWRLRLAWGGTKGSGIGSNQEAYIVSAVLGLLALFMGFTLALSLDRFEARRSLVLQEANAIGTAFLRTQLLRQPHRERLTGLITSYLENRIDISNASADELTRRLATNDRLLVDIWAATAAAFDAVRDLDYSSSFLDTINTVIDLDTSRKTAYSARVPFVVFAVLFVFILITSGLLGYVLTGWRGRILGCTLLLMLGLALLLMMDIDRPTRGWVQENQAPLEALQRSIASQPASVYDKWRTSP